VKSLILFVLGFSTLAEGAAMPNFAAYFGKRWSSTHGMAVGVAGAMPPHE
jgi:hypothetical protein